MSKVKLHTIELHPTFYKLDILVCSDRDRLAKFMSKRYGEDESYYLPILTKPFCGVIEHSGEYANRIVICTPTYNVITMAHEVIHATWQLDNIAGFKMNYTSQEFQAYMVSYILSHLYENK